MRLAAYLADLRNRAELTQHEAARRIGVSRVQLARWEKGHYQPGEERLMTVAEVYDVDVRVLREMAGLPVERHPELSPWTLNIARRLEKRAAHLPQRVKARLESNIDTVLALADTCS